MLRYIALLGVLTLVTQLYTQKYNHQWLFGYDNNSGSPSFGISMLDFNDGQVNVEYWNPSIHDVGGESSFISNAITGQVELFTNGCRVWDAAQNSLTDEDNLMNDWASPIYCPKEHPTTNATLLLPNLVHDTAFYLVQKDANYSDEIGYRSDRLYLHTIERRDDDQYELTSTDVILDTPLVIGHLTAGPNYARDGWWFSVVEHETDRHFMYELGPDGQVAAPVMHNGGPIGDQSNWDIGQASFSPDMSIWANSTEQNGIMLFDFDNATGELSNYREIHYPNMITAEGLCFSPNGRFIYMTTAEDIYQIDLHATDTSEQVYHISHVRFPSPYDGWPVGLGYMHLGPDCRIYVSPGTTTPYLHVIHNPDGYQAACQFDEAAILVPTRVAHHLPNLPNYYYLNGCDPDIAWGIPVSTTAPGAKTEWTVFPNPARSRIVLQRQNSVSTEQNWVLYNLQGIKVREVSLAGNYREVDLTSLPTGSYFWRVEETGQQGRLVVVR